MRLSVKGAKGTTAGKGNAHSNDLEKVTAGEHREGICQRGCARYKDVIETEGKRNPPMRPLLSSGNNQSPSISIGGDIFNSVGRKIAEH